MSTSQIDTAQTLKINESPLKLIIALLGAGAFVTFAIVVLTQLEPTTTLFSRNGLTWIAMSVTVLFFGLVAIIILARLINREGPVLTISPDGIKDLRVSPDLISWPTIASISTWQHSGQKIMILALHPGEEQRLTLTRLAKWSRGANAKLGADGLAISASGTKISYDDLMATTIAYADAYGRPD